MLSQKSLFAGDWAPVCAGVTVWINPASARPFNPSLVRADLPFGHVGKGQTEILAARLVAATEAQTDAESGGSRARRRQVLAVQSPDALRWPAEPRQGRDDRACSAAFKGWRLGARKSAALPCRLQPPSQGSRARAERADAHQRCDAALVQQAGGRDAEHGGELFEDADAGIASGPLKIAQIDLGHAGFEGDILLRPLPFGTKHPQISRKPVTDVHAPIAPRNRPQSDH